MAYSIGFAGKGGTGKTTLAGLLIQYLVERQMTPVLAVDADANFNLNEVLGLNIFTTLGTAREEMKKVNTPGMTKDVYMSLKLEQALVEARGFDLLVMGRPEGPGCYCAANTLLSKYLEKLVQGYAFLVMDNEAGLEHISRLIVRKLDLLLIISDASIRGLRTAERINDLSRELELKINKTGVIINRTPPNQPTELIRIAQDLGLHLAGTIPEDDQIREWGLRGRPLIELNKENKARSAAHDIFEQWI